MGMDDQLRIVSGGRWTQDGRWVVVGVMVEGGPEVIVFDPCNGMKDAADWTMALVDLHDCMHFVQDVEDGVHGLKG